MDSSKAEGRSILRLLKASAWGVAAGFGAGFGAAFGAAIPLAVLNLYLSGHGVTWPEKVHAFGFISLSCLDALLLSIALAALFTVARQRYRQE
jgi:hypothetical protein